MPTNTPDDLIASAPPPDFSEARRRRFPHLAAEDTNPAYIAFKRRRLLHDTKQQLRTEASLSTIDIAVSLVGLALVFSEGNVAGFQLGLMGRVAGLALLLIGSLRSFGILSDPFRRDVPAPLPLNTIDLLEGARGPTRQALIELWLAGIKGGELVEAAALDAERRRHKFLRACLMAAGGAGLLLGWLVVRRHLDLPMSFFYMASMMAVGLTMAWLLLVRLTPGFAANNIVESWLHQIEAAGGRVPKLDSNQAVEVPALLRPHLLRITVSSVVGILWMKSTIEFLIGSYAVNTFTLVVFSLLVLVACGLMLLMWGRPKNVRLGNLAHLKSQADVLFTVFMRAVLLDDVHEDEKPLYIKYTDETWNQR